jgi:hypothetical protein
LYITFEFPSRRKTRWISCTINWVIWPEYSSTSGPDIMPRLLLQYIVRHLLLQYTLASLRYIVHFHPGFHSINMATRHGCYHNSVSLSHL